MKLRTIAALSLLAVALAFVAAGCGSPTSPTNPNQVKFIARLLPANEVPPITDAEASGFGFVTITFDLTKDSAGTITGATATFDIQLTGFPANTPINIAHIHEGAATCVCPVRVSTTLGAGQLILTNGSGTSAKTGINVNAANAQGIVNTPENYYFNVHSTLNPNGVARGPLEKQ